MRAVHGPAEQGLLGLGFAYAAYARTAVLVVAGVLAPIAAGEGQVVAATAAAVVAVGWGLVYARELLRGPRSWLLPVDVAVVVGLALTARWTVPPDALTDGTSWVLAVASMSVVAYQWHTGRVAGAVATAAVVAAQVWGAGTVDGPSFGVWMLAEAALSRVLFVLVGRAGRAADRESAEQEVVRRTAAVAAAGRADEREQLAALHDTAAATLLMVGLGAVPGRRPWLSAQAARDLDVLRPAPPAGRVPSGPVDLRVVLRRVVGESAGCAADLVLPPAPLLVPHGVATAVEGAVGEALCNVLRHAPGAATRVSAVAPAGRGVQVIVVDDGPGFDPVQRRPGRRGISGSIVERMAACGGTAVVDSLAGRGTTVWLGWPGS